MRVKNSLVFGESESKIFCLLHDSSEKKSFQQCQFQELKLFQDLNYPFYKSYREINNRKINNINFGLFHWFFLHGRTVA